MRPLSYILPAVIALVLAAFGPNKPVSQPNSDLDIKTPHQLRAANAAQMVQLAELTGHAGAVYSISWSPDGNLLASGSSDGTIRIWDATTNELVRAVETQQDSVWGVAWSPTGHQLASVGSNGTIIVWDPSTGDKLKTIPVDPADANTVYCVV